METSKVSSTTPKRRDREAWTVTYHSREPLPFDQETEDIGRGDNIEKSHHSKENIRMIERPSRRSHASPTVEKWRRESHDFLKQHAPPSPTVDVPSRERVVETDADGYAIPLVERNSASLTPSGNDQAHASTPSEQASPNEVFFTPMTHPRPSQRERDVPRYATPSSVPHLAATPTRPQFSLINERLSAAHSPFERDASIKERTEARLAACDDLSNKLDNEIQQIRESLSQPIRLGLPALDNSSTPAFSDHRQTIDNSQLGSLRVRKDESPRRSLPQRGQFSSADGQLRAPPNSVIDNIDRLAADFDTSGTRDEGADQKNKNVNPKQTVEISMPKALGASMAAEIAYAERVEHTRVHVTATRHLARKVEKMSDAQRDANDDLDKILNSISLRDASLRSFEEEEKKCALDGSMRNTSKLQETPQPLKMRTTSTAAAARVLSGEGLEERKRHVDAYVRMRRKLRNLQIVALKLWKRSATSAELSVSTDRLLGVVDKELKVAVEGAHSLLYQQHLSTREFMTEIMLRQKKVYEATKQCSDTVIRLLGLATPAEPGEPIAPTEPDLEQLREPVRIPPKVVNKNVNNGAGDLSARTMRHNLDLRREQAEMLNKSFEEKSRNIEQMTKESIAVQIDQYDRVIAERKELINRLDQISSEEQSEAPADSEARRTPTPRRDGVCPLDFSQLSEDTPGDDKAEREQDDMTPLAADAAGCKHEDEGQTDAVIARTRSECTVYEDSYSHFSDEDDRHDSESSDGTLYQSDLENHVQDEEEKESHHFPSRRTLDTAETLAMLSRSTVAVVTTTAPRDEVQKEIAQIIDEALRSTDSPSLQVESETTPRPPKPVEGDSGALEAPTDAGDADVAFVSYDDGSYSKPKTDEEEAAGTEDRTELSGINDEKFAAGDGAGTDPLAEAVSEASAASEVVTDDQVAPEPQIDQKMFNVPCPPRPPKDFSRLRLFFGSPDEPTEDSVEREEFDESLQNDQFVFRTQPLSEVAVEDIDESTYTKPAPDTESIHEEEEDHIPVITFTNFVYKEPIPGEIYEEDEDLEKTQWEVTPPASPVRTTVHPLLGGVAKEDVQLRHEEIESQEAEETSKEGDSSTGDVDDWLTDDEEQPSVGTGEYTESEDEEEMEEERLKTPGAAVIDKSEAICPVDSAEEKGGDDGSGEEVGVASGHPEQIEGIESEHVAAEDVKTDGEAVQTDKDSLDLSLELTVNDISTRDPNRSEICDTLSTSILQMMLDPSSPRCPPQPIRRRYELNDSVLEDSITARSPRTPQERFITKMPGSLSPRYQALMDESLSASVLEVIAKTEAVMSATDEKLREINEEMEKMKLRDPTGEESQSKPPRDAIFEAEHEFTAPVPPVAPKQPVASEEDTIVDQNAKRDGVGLAFLDGSLDETCEDLFTIEKPASIFDSASATSGSQTGLASVHVLDTPRKIVPRPRSPPSLEDIKKQRLLELREQLNSEDWITKTCLQYSKEAWAMVGTKGFVRLLYDELIERPASVDGVVAEGEEEQMLLDINRDLVWAAVIELAAMLWPEHPDDDGRGVSTKWRPIPRNEKEFEATAVKYVLEQLGELPPTHRAKRQSRPVPSLSETSVDGVVARLFYRDRDAFERQVVTEYRKMCEELIEKVGDRFISSELEQAQEERGVDESLLSQSATFGHVSGDFGRPSLARLSIASGQSIGRRSSTSAVTVPPLLVEESEI